MKTTRKRGVLSGIASLALLFALAACGGGNGDAGGADTQQNKGGSASPEPSPEPITLKVSDQLFSEEEFNKFVKGPVEKKFPHLTLERVVPNNTNHKENVEQYATWAATQEVPDILLRYGQGTSELNELDIPANLSEQVKRTNMDLSVYDKSLLETAYNFSRPGMREASDDYLATLPLYANFRVLLFNKDIFDMFGVAYPKEGMTYDDIVDLSKQLTRMEGGVQYKGYNVTWNMFNDQLSLPLVDPETNKSLVDQLPGYKQIFEFGKAFYSIPGTKNESDKTVFFKEKRQAMSSYWVSDIVKNFAIPENQSINWDMTVNPVFEPGGANAGLDYHAAYVSKTSKHQNEAFEVIRYLSTSTEAQTLFARNGYVPTLNDPSIREQWGVDVPYLKGKNLSVVAKTKTAPRFEVTRFDAAVNKYVFEAFGKMNNEGMDVNTALRMAAELMNKDIQALLAQ